MVLAFGELLCCSLKLTKSCSARRRHSEAMASRFMVKQADPSVFVSADDVRDSGGGGSSSPAATVDSPRPSTASSSKPSTADDKTPSVAFVDSAADDRPPSNNFSVADDECYSV